MFICPKCGEKTRFLYGQRRIGKDGHVSNDGEPHICGDCKHRQGEKTTAERLEEFRQSIVTTAPHDYDGFGTEHIANCGYYGNDRVRMVSILTEYYDWQVQRYWSGNYWVRTFAEWCDMQKRGAPEEIGHMHEEWLAWQEVVACWPGDINDPQWNLLVYAIQHWGERLVRLRENQTVDKDHILRKAADKYYAEKARQNEND